MRDSKLDNDWTAKVLHEQKPAKDKRITLFSFPLDLEDAAL